MLQEAKDQVPHGSWARWLTKNFELSKSQAQRYMRLARLAADDTFKNRAGASTLDEAIGYRTPSDRRATWRDVHQATNSVNVTRLADERQTRDNEIKLHRELALQLIDLGFKAMATRLHPDRGGSRDAMSRLNNVREELKQFAATRRFV
jgi:hypothetical protein